MLHLLRKMPVFLASATTAMSDELFGDFPLARDLLKRLLLQRQLIVFLDSDTTAVLVEPSGDFPVARGLLNLVITTPMDCTDILMILDTMP